MPLQIEIYDDETDVRPLIGRYSLDAFCAENDLDDDYAEEMYGELKRCGMWIGGGGEAPQWTAILVKEEQAPPPVTPAPLALAANQPRLPSRRVPHVLSNFETSRWLSVQPHRDGFALVLDRHVIDRHGEKDTYTDEVSVHATLAGATAAFNGYGATAQARAA